MDDANALVDRLCELAGTIMEDISVTAVSVGKTEDRATKIEAVRAAGADIAALGQAASTIMRYSASCKTGTSDNLGHPPP